MSLEVGSKPPRSYSLQQVYQKKQEFLSFNSYVSSNMDINKLESNVIALTVLIQDIKIQEDRLVSQTYPEMLSYLKEKEGIGQTP